MKTKTIAASRLTLNHQIVLRDLDGTRKAFQIVRITRMEPVITGKPRITTWFKDSFGSETPAGWRPRDRAEILVEDFTPTGDQPLRPDLQSNWT